MNNIRQVIAGAIFSLTAVVSSAPVLAQTATPTPTASPTVTASPTATCTPRNDPGVCTGAKKIQLSWLAKDPLAVRVAVSATGCPEVPSCFGTLDGELVAIAPVSLTVADAATQSVSKTITDPGINSGGCPGGKDTYRGADRLRFIYGTSTTVVGKVRIAQTSLTPAVVAPLTFTVRDACGPVARGVVTTCFTKSSLVRTDVKCF